MIPYCECGRGKVSWCYKCYDCLVEEYGKDKVDQLNRAYADSLREILAPKKETTVEDH